MVRKKSQCRRALEALYGKLGEAQLAEIERLIAENEGFIHLEAQAMWQRLNSRLAAPDYTVDRQEEVSMEQLFSSGDEYPDIFQDLDDVEDVDMDSLL